MPRVRTRIALTAAAIAALTHPPASAQSTWPGRDRIQPEQCTPATGDAVTWLRRADSATGIATLGNQVVSFHAFDSSLLLEQSDRVYPPFVMLPPQEQAWWFDPATGVERSGAAANAPRNRDIARTEHAAYLMRDTGAVVIPALRGVVSPTRALNPLAVLRDWEAATDLSVAERCVFRDYPRIVLRRAASAERLYLDMHSGIPVKLEREEPHYLWGQVRVEYVYTTWFRAGATILPFETARYLDGVQDMNRTLAFVGHGVGDVILPDSAPSLKVPADAGGRPAASASVTASSTDTVRIGPSTYLLVNPAYTQAVTFVRDTVFLLDATMGDARSRADSVWIAALFPGHHPIVVVVTDIAWPHVAGLRYWVARGATIVTHPVSKPFLEAVLNRRWTLKPDALEQQRATVHPVIRTTAGALNLAAGAIRLTAIDGIASEGALIAFLPGDRFLWASDYIQDASAPTEYAREVFRAVTGAGFAPARFAAEHMPLTLWSAIENLERAGG